MSSVAAIRGSKEAPYVYTEKDWNDQSEKLVAEKGADAGWGPVYSASKTAGEKAFWAFRDKFRPDWTMAAVNPV